MVRKGRTRPDLCNTPGGRGKKRHAVDSESLAESQGGSSDVHSDGPMTKMSKEGDMDVKQQISIGVACRLGLQEITLNLLCDGHRSYPDDRGWWPIHEAVFGLHMECCQMLIEIDHCDVNKQAHDGITPLLLVCRRNSEHERACQIADLLLNNGADPNIRSLDEMTHLIQALKSNNRALVNLLLKKGANPFDKWYNKWTALHETANTQNAEAMRYLIDIGLDVFAIDDDGHSALFVAVQENFVEGVKILLEAAKDRDAELANICLSNGASCVMVASCEGYDEVLHELIKHNADCNIVHRPVWDPNCRMHSLAAAAQNDCYNCLNMLLPLTDKAILANTEMDPLVVAAYRGSTQCVRRLLDIGYPTETFAQSPPCTVIIRYLQPILMRHYHTALREAVRKNYPDIVRLLVQAGAKMMYSSFAYSPFLFAFRNRLDPMIKRIFLENNVDLNMISDESLCRVPDALISSLGTENRRTLLLLLKCGLKPNLKFWCACSNPSKYCLFLDVSQTTYVCDFDELIKLLVIFSSQIPRCCSLVADAVNCGQQVATLMHLTRMALRAHFPSSQLIDNRFTRDLPLPNTLKHFLAFRPMPTPYLLFGDRK